MSWHPTAGAVAALVGRTPPGYLAVVGVVLAQGKSALAANDLSPAVRLVCAALGVGLAF